MRFFLRTLTLALVLVGAVEASAQGLNTQYTFQTLTNLLARDPRSIAKDGRATVTVLGRDSLGDMGSPMVLTYSDTDTATEEEGCIWAPESGVGRYRSRECDEGVFNLRRFGALLTSTNDVVAALRAAGSALQARGSGTLVAPSGRYLVRTPSGTGIGAYFSNLTSFRLSADTATFVTDDFGDSSFLSATLTVSGTTATATTATAHGLSVGNTVVVKNSSVLGYDGPYTVATTPTATNLTFSLSGYSTPVTSATALIRGQHYYYELFRFKACTNVHLGTLRFQGTVQPRDIQYRLGWVAANFREHCQTIRGEIDVRGAAYGIWTGDYDNATTGDSRDFDVTITAQDVGYPVSAWGSGHDSTFRIVGQSLHRGMYAAAVRRSSIHAWIRDYDVAGVLLTHQPQGGTNLLGCENVQVSVTDTGTSEDIKLLAVGATRYMVTVAGYSGTTPVSHRNLGLRVFAKNAPDTSAMQILTYATNQCVEGLTLSGFLDQRDLAVGDVRHDFYVDQTSASSGIFRDISIRDLTVLSPANLGGYNATLKLTNLVNDVLVDNYTSGQARNFVFPPGRAIASVPTFPGWRYSSSEGSQIQQMAGGVKLSATKITVPLSAAPGDSDFTLHWVGSVPTSGNTPLFVVTTAAAADAGSLGASVTNGHLLVRLYGASDAHWRGVLVTNWQSTAGGRVSSLGITRTTSGLSVWTDGHRNQVAEYTAGTAPAWTNAVAGTNWICGIDTTGTTYSGTVYRAGAWNSDRTSEWPALALAWTGGQTQLGAATNLVDGTSRNGGFETLGTGGTDPFADWSELAQGTSAVSVSTNAVSGTNSMAFVVDSSNSYAGATVSGAEYGATYQVSFWARVSSGGVSGAVNVVGPADGESTVQITDSWARYTVTKVWAATGITIKRSDLASRTAVIDDVTVRRMGALGDMDWTVSPADLVTGTYAAPSGGAASRVVSRGWGMSGDRGDASATLRSGHDAPVQIWATTLTGARTITLATDHCVRGDWFRLVRTATGAGTLTVASPVSRAIASDEWLDVVYNGTAWSAVAYGKIAGAYGSGGGGTNTWKIEVNTTEVTEPDLTDTSTVEWSAVGSTVSAAVKTGSLGTNYLTGAAYAALKDLGTATGTLAESKMDSTMARDSEVAAEISSLSSVYQPLDPDLTDLADGSLAGSKVGSGIDDDNVSFDDGDNLWTATAVGAALEELNDSINSGVPNGTGAKLHWSQLLGVPAGFADGTDDGAGGGSGDVVGPAISVDGDIPAFDGTTGKLLKTSGIAATNVLTKTSATNTYQLADSDLTDLADGTLTGSKVGSGIDGGNVTTGTVADARIDAAIARDSEVAAGYQPLDSDLTDLADGTLTGSKVGSGIDDDNVSFDDGDGIWTATTIGAAFEELNDSINSGVPNGTGAKLHWSQLLGVPAGFADGTDDGAGGGSGDVISTNSNTLTGINYFTNALGQVFSVPPRVLGARINGWTAPQMTPGTNAAMQAQFKVLGDGIPTLEFDGATSEEISMVGLLSQDPDRGSFVTLTFASDDTANTVCWQAQWQLLTLRGIDTNLLSAAATWTSNIPGTARVPTNITFSLNAPTGLVGSTNDYSKPYMLRITRLPGSDSSLSNAYLIGVDHRYGL